MLFENNCQNFVKYLFESISPEPFPLQTITILLEFLFANHPRHCRGIPGRYPSLTLTSSSSGTTSFRTATEGRGSFVSAYSTQSLRHVLEESRDSLLHSADILSLRLFILKHF